MAVATNSAPVRSCQAASVVCWSSRCPRSPRRIECGVAGFARANRSEDMFHPSGAKGRHREISMSSLAPRNPTTATFFGSRPGRWPAGPSARHRRYRPSGLARAGDGQVLKPAASPESSGPATMAARRQHQHRHGEQERAPSHRRHQRRRTITAGRAPIRSKGRSSG